MIDRLFGRQRVVCDECDEPFEKDFSHGAFAAMIEAVKTEGWTVRPSGIGGWNHICPDCNSTPPTSLAQQKKLLGL